MGVSNIIGSNVFDLLIGLAFPWFVKSILSQGYVNDKNFFLIFFILCLLCFIYLINLLY
jgi:Ca2+/Na+ antiporter